MTIIHTSDRDVYENDGHSWEKLLVEVKFLNELYSFSISSLKTQFKKKGKKEKTEYT